MSYNPRPQHHYYEATRPAFPSVQYFELRLPSRLNDMKDITLLDIGAHFLDENGFLLKGFMPDTTHPSEKGYEIWAKAMEPELKKLLGEQ